MTSDQRQYKCNDFGDFFDALGENVDRSEACSMGPSMIVNDVVPAVPGDQPINRRKVDARLPLRG